MKREVPTSLVMFVAVATAILFMGINAIDSMVSVLVSLSPKPIEGDMSSFLIRGMSFINGYHLGIVLVIVGYFLAIGIFCWYLSKKKTKEIEKDDTKKDC